MCFVVHSIEFELKWELIIQSLVSLEVGIRAISTDKVGSAACDLPASFQSLFVVDMQ